jgi:hypothetical protein
MSKRIKEVQKEGDLSFFMVKRRRLQLKEISKLNLHNSIKILGSECKKLNSSNFVWAEIDGKKHNWEDIAKKTIIGLRILRLVLKITI